MSWCAVYPDRALKRLDPPNPTAQLAYGAQAERCSTVATDIPVQLLKVWLDAGVYQATCPGVEVGDPAKMFDLSSGSFAAERDAAELPA